MDLVTGGSLVHLVGDYGPLPPSFVCVLLDQLLSGLGAVHAEGVVHRDIKPANVLLEATGTARPRLRLSDFGIAMRLGEPRLTETDYVVGTPGYLAPEQLMGADPDFAADLFAVGLVALYLLEGRQGGHQGTRRALRGQRHTRAATRCSRAPVGGRGDTAATGPGRTVPHRHGRPQGPGRGRGTAAGTRPRRRAGGGLRPTRTASTGVRPPGTAAHAVGGDGPRGRPAAHERRPSRRGALDGIPGIARHLRDGRRPCAAHKRSDTAPADRSPTLRSPGPSAVPGPSGTTGGAASVTPASAAPAVAPTPPPPAARPGPAPFVVPPRPPVDPTPTRRPATMSDTGSFHLPPPLPREALRPPSQPSTPLAPAPARIPRHDPRPPHVPGRSVSQPQRLLGTAARPWTPRRDPARPLPAAADHTARRPGGGPAPRTAGEGRPTGAAARAGLLRRGFWALARL